MRQPESLSLFPLHLKTLFPAFLAVIAGGLHAASLAWPVADVEVAGTLLWHQGDPVWGLQIGSMAILVGLLLHTRHAGQAARLGGLFALSWLALTFGWLYISMHRYGGLSAVLAGSAVLFLSAALAVYYALACGVFKALVERQRSSAPLVFALCWLLAELARGQWLTGFGWGAAGYAHPQGPLRVWLGWIGMYGTTAVAAVMSGCLALMLVKREKASQSAAGWTLLSLAVMTALLPQVETLPQGQLHVTLLQGNVAQEEKFQPATGVMQSLAWYGENLRLATGELVITPETALPVVPDQLPDGYWTALAQRFSNGTQAALIGMPMGDPLHGYTNSVVGFGGLAAEPPWRYDKHHLVPFGEFIPPLFRWFTDLMHIPLGDFDRGALPQPTFNWNGQRLAATICYENLFSEELATYFVDVATAPTLFFNVSNLGWFGEHLAMDQHLQIARVRALEFARPFLLATNTGRTAIVDHRGVVTQQAPSHVPTSLQGSVQGRSGLTPYARWSSRWGQWPLWSLALVGLALVAWIGQRARLRRD